LKENTIYFGSYTIRASLTEWNDSYHGSRSYNVADWDEECVLLLFGDVAHVGQNGLYVVVGFIGKVRFIGEIGRCIEFGNNLY
jgi:hypothetical protein